jgi:hypothetical protein
MIGKLIKNELGRIWKEAVVIFRHLPGGTEDNLEEPQSSGLWVSSEAGRACPSSVVFGCNSWTRTECLKIG